MDLSKRCEGIMLVLSDVDGVLTDGGLIYDNQGIESKRFHVRDGLGIKLWQRADYRFGIVTQRSSQVVKMRAAELGIPILRQGSSNKWTTVEEILDQENLAAEQVCYIGDDLPDLPVIRKVGLGVAVADAVEEVRSGADYVTQLPGGAGAVREVIEMILRAQGRWEELIPEYTG